MLHSLSHTLSKWLLVAGLALTPLALPAQEQQSVVDSESPDAGMVEPAQPPTTGTVVYKSTDKDGKTAFTDMPPVDRPSDAVTVKPSNTMSLPRGVSNEMSEGGRAAVKYTSLIVTSPQNDEFFGQEVQAITLSATAQPGIQDGHTAQLYYDGNPVGDASLFYTVAEPERGTHTVVAKIFNARGVVVIESDPVQFHVRRISILNPFNHHTQPAEPAESANSPSGAGGAGGTAPPPPSGGFGGAKGFGNSSGSGNGAAVGGAGGAGSAGSANSPSGAAPRPGR